VSRRERQREREIQKLQKKYGTERRLSLASDMAPEPHWPIRDWGKGEKSTVCPGSSDPPEKIFNIFESENEVYTNY